MPLIGQPPNARHTTVEGMQLAEPEGGISHIQTFAERDEAIQYE